MGMALTFADDSSGDVLFSALCASSIIPTLVTRCRPPFTKHALSSSDNTIQLTILILVLASTHMLTESASTTHLIYPGSRLVERNYFGVDSGNGEKSR